LKAPRRIYPQILSRWFRIAGTFCRQRWFARYARSESLLCTRPLAKLQTTGDSFLAVVSVLLKY